MNSRQWMVQIHLVLAALFLPFLLLMPLSGALYLLDQKGDQVKENVFVVSGTPPEDQQAQEKFFREQFSKNNIDYDFEYIKTSPTDYLFRPTSRTYYVATPIDGVLTMQKVKPTLLKRMLEIHKGHGPQLIRIFEIAFGFSLLLVAFSGIWIAYVTPKYRKSMLISFAVGFFVIVSALF